MKTSFLAAVIAPVFSFEKGLNGQNHSFAGSHLPVKKSPQQNFWPSPIEGNFPLSPYHFLGNPEVKCLLLVALLL